MAASAEAAAVARDPWHARELEDIGYALDADLTRGLTAAEAARRLTVTGPNELRKGEAVSPLSILAAQFRSLVIWVLIVAALVSTALGEMADGVAIIAIVLLNALIGFAQEFRAEKAAAALARLTAPRAKVLRDGAAVVIAAREVVHGDVLLLEGGDFVAADARLIEVASLRTNEAPLTGESQPVEKHAGVFPPATPLADRANMVFLGTSVAGGTARAAVVATGMQTEVGHIARLLETAASGETPLQQRLDRVARRLLWACLAIVALVFALGLARGSGLFELFLGAVSLAVAAIPEGLPAAVTVALALGVQRMIRRNVLVKRLRSVETLGCTQVICTDKTGTLTVGEMTARKVVTSVSAWGVEGEGYASEGSFYAQEAGRRAADDPLLLRLLRAAAACNDAELGNRDSRPVVIGDPTEGALLVVAAKGGITRPDLDARLPRLATLPFDSDRKRMTVVRRVDSEAIAFVKGAPEVILDRCTHLLTEEGVRTLTPEDRQGTLRAAAMLANDALRVLALAERNLGPVDALSGPVECGLTLLGMVGLQDPPRAEARDAVTRCRRAGIKTVMITGDHPDTARAIARELGVLSRDGEVAVGSDLDRWNEAELASRVERIAVYARVTAEHKLRIVRAWKTHGAVVAMTGDGVNDAPALREASIGIAMGITGTEVTREAADIIITDDNFASIVAAVEEGRGIYDNIAKTLAYLLAGNAGELTLMLSAVLLGWPLPLLPIQLLWINLVTDGLPALALATDPIDRNVLDRPPRRPDAELLDRAFLKLTALTGLLTAGVALFAFGYELNMSGNLDQARDAAFTALVISELLRAFGARSNTQTVWQVGLFSNMRLFGIVAASFALQLLIHHVPALQALFGTGTVSMGQCLAWIALGAVPLVLLELRKVLVARTRIAGGSMEAIA